MRTILVKILQLLDGTPAVYGKRQAGQSVVELALITPILIILLAGLVEIGWFANNYLNLLDVSRIGARRAAVLRDQQSPLFWENKYSYVPNYLLSAAYQVDASGYYQMANSTTAEQASNGTDEERSYFRWMPEAFSVYPYAGDPRKACDPGQVERSFYNEVLCTMITSLEPLSLNPSNGIDDMIISGFALQMVDPTAHAYTVLPAQHPGADDEPQVIVVGRYPTNANECDVLNSGGVPVLSSRPGDESRDPFDLNDNNARDVAYPDTPSTDPNVPPEVAGHFTEIAGFDVRPSSNPSDTNYDADWEQHAEKQVGFSLFGNHKIAGTYCVGSDWTLSAVEDLMNLPNYDPGVQEEYLPNQGLVMVEIFWQHEMLLKIPVLSPVFSAAGNDDGKMVINVWAAFPLASVEPHIQFR